MQGLPRCAWRLLVQLNYCVIKLPEQLKDIHTATGEIAQHKNQHRDNSNTPNISNRISIIRLEYKECPKDIDTAERISYPTKPLNITALFRIAV
nr:MAG TPA: hypothetical protein [Inoviridae sp.]